jgi:HlyD family secretion protein
MVRRVEPAGFKRVSALGVEEQRVRIVCDLLAPKSAWKRLGDGYRVDALFTLQHYSNQPVIPSSALFLENGQWKVFRVIKGRANKKPLKIIANNGIKAAIKGLAEGEQVIINPSEGVAEGIAVKVDE